MENQRRTIAHRDGEVVTCNQCPDRPYLQVVVPPEIERVEKIVLRITSHDQGFCDNPSAGSWSWTTFSIISPAGHERIVPFRITDSKLVIYNEIGDYDYKDHVREWAIDDADRSVCDILRAVRSGDKLRLVPAARFKGWQSYVKKATIEVYGGSMPDLRSPVIHHRQSDLLHASHRLHAPLREKLGEIRLLKIRPGQGNAKIYCELIRVSLTHRGHAPYEALSYCWGNSLNTRTIKLAMGGQEPVDFAVTHNLYDALVHLRYAHDDRLFWIDAICINQVDDEERAQQVAIMRQIYSTARSVVVWLGSGSEDIAKVIDDVNIVAQRYEKAKQAPMKTADTFEMHHVGDMEWWNWRDSVLLSLDYLAHLGIARGVQCSTYRRTLWR